MKEKILPALKDYGITILTFGIAALTNLLVYKLMPTVLDNSSSEIYVSVKRFSGFLGVLVFLGMVVAMPRQISITPLLSKKTLLTTALILFCSLLFFSVIGFP